MSQDLGRYKKERWIQYGFWFIAGVLVAAVIFFLIKYLNEKTTIAVPQGYNYSIEDHYTKNEALWSTYYVYSNYILVTKDGEEDSPIIAYDGIDTSIFGYDENDTTKACDADSCYTYPRALDAIKKYLSTKYGREYIGR